MSYFFGMETDTTNIILQKGDVLSPKQVRDLELLPGVTLGWFYRHWNELGGVTIGNKKFIKIEVLNASLQGNKREVADQGEGTSQGFPEVSDTSSSRNGNNKLANKKRSKKIRKGVGEIGPGEILSDHSNDFGLSEFV